jgi:fibronectin-binding autotransporter adhesin
MAKRFLLAGLLIVGSWGLSARAQDSWTGAGSNGYWTNENNWFIFTVPAPGASIAFDANSTANLGTTLGADFAVNGITVVDPAGAVSIASNLLTVGAGGLDLSAALQNLTISSPLVLDAVQDWSVATGRTLAINTGVLSGLGVTKKGPGVLTVAGANTNLAGPVTIEEGVVSLGHGAALGTNDIVINTAATVNDTDVRLALNQTTLSRFIVQDLGTGIPFFRSVDVNGNDNEGGGSPAFRVELRGRGIRIGGGTDRFSPVGGGISGTGSVTVLGTPGNRTTFQSMANTYSGATVVAAGGTLQINGDEMIPNNSDVTVDGVFQMNTGAETFDALDGTGVVQNITGGGRTITVGADGGSGTFAGRLGPGAGGGTLLLVKAGAGTQTLGGTSDNPSAVARLNTGTLVLAKSSGPSVHALGANGVGLTIQDGLVQFGGTGGDQLFTQLDVLQNNGVLDLNGTSEGWDQLDGTNGVVRNDAAATLSVMTLGQNGGGMTYRGSIHDGAGQVEVVKVGAGTLLLGGTNTYSGPTTISGGVLQVDGALGTGAVTLAAGTGLAGFGTVGGPVSIAGGGRLDAATLTTTGTLSVAKLGLTASVTSRFNLVTANTVGAGVNDLIAVGGDLDGQGSVVEARFATAPGAGPYRLFNYGGSLVSGFSLGLTNAGRYGLTLDTTTVGQVNLLISGSAGNLRWNGTTSSAWDLNTTANWYDLVAATPGASFLDFDSVLFDDTPGVTTTVAVTGTLQPGSVRVAADTNVFTFSSAGKLSGAMGLVKSGTNRFVLANTGGNDFTGGITVSNGVLALGAGTALPVGGTVVIRNGASLDFAGQGAGGRVHTFIVEGSGPAGQGVLFNSGGGIFGNSSVSNLIQTGDATMGATGRWDIGTGGAGLRWAGNGFAMTKVGAGEITVRPEFISNVARMVISAGRIKHESFSRTTADTVASTNIVLSGATLASHGTLTLNFPVEFQGGLFNNDNGTATWTGPMSLWSNTTMNLGNPVVLAGVVSGPGQLIKAGASSLTLSNANTFAGEFQMINGGGDVYASSALGPSLPSRVTLGSGHTVAGITALRTFRNNQFGPGVVVTNRGSWNDWTYLVLMGTTQTLAGLSDETGAGVLEATESEAGISSDALLIFNGSGSYSCNSYTRDRSGGTSTSKLRMLMTGSGTQTLAGSNRAGQPDFSGGLIISNGWINLKSHRAAGSGLIELAGGGLALDGTGLAEDRSPANGWNTTFTNDYEAVVHYPYFAGDPVDADAAGPTWCYTGYFNVTNATPVTWTFVEQYDDNAYLKLDGEVLLNNTTWNVPTIATRTLQPGLHAIEFRVHSTDLGIGPNAGWTNGIGYDAEGRNTATATNFVPFLDPGDGSFLQTLVRVTNAIQLRADASLKVSSAWGPTNVISGPITELGGSFGLTKVGAGTLALEGSHVFSGPTFVQAGGLLIRQMLPAASVVTVRSNSYFGGRGTAGTVTVDDRGALRISGEGLTGNLELNALTLGADAASTTRVSVVLGTITNILSVGDAGGLTANGKVVIDVSAVGAVPGGVYDLIRYNGALGGSLANFELGQVLFTMLRGPAYLQDSGSAIQLVVPAGAFLIWDGTPVNWWDVLGFLNWVGFPGGPGLQFQDGDAVVFDDTAQDFSMEVSVPVGPSSILVRAETNDYTFGGGSSITGAVGLTKAGAGTLFLFGTNANTGPLVISNGVVSVDRLADGGVAGPWGAQSTNAANLQLNGGTLRYTGAGGTMNRRFQVGAAGGAFDVSSGNSTMTLNGSGWVIGGPLTKRGPGTLRFINYGYSFANAATDLIIQEGVVRLDSDYWFNTGAGPYPYDATTSMKVIVTNGARLETVRAALGFQPAPGDGSLDEVVVEKDSTWNLSGANGVGVLTLRGGRVLGARLIPLYGMTFNVRASDTNSYCSSEWNPYYTGNTWALDVEDGAADPDFIQDGPINANLSTLNRTGVGRMLYRNTAFGPVTLNIAAGGVMQLGDDTAAGSLGAGAGTVNNAGTLIYGHASAVTEGKTFAGTGSLVHAGSGVTVLTAANTYSGATTISGGTLRVNGTLAAASAVAVLPAGRLGGSGVVSGTVALAGQVAPGASVGTLTTGSETWEGGASYQFEVSDVAGTFGAHPGWDRLQVEGDLTINATPGSQFLIDVRTVNGAGLSAPVIGLSADSAYTMKFARVTGTLSGFDSAAFTVSVQNAIGLFTLTNGYVQQTGGDLELVLQSGGQTAPLIWDPSSLEGGAQDGDGNWSLIATNWWTGTQDVPWPAVAASAQIGAGTNPVGGSYSITVDAAVVQAYSILFPTGSTYTVTGTGRLDVTGGDLTVSNDAATIAAQVGGNGFTKRGPGTLTLTRTGVANAYTGTITVAEGAVVAAGTAADGVIRGDVRVGSGAEFRLGNANIIANTANLNVAPGGMVNLGGLDEWIGNLTGGGTVTSSAGTVRLDYLQPGSDYVFNGSLLGAWTLYLENNQTRGGTLWLNGTNLLTGIQVEGDNTLRLSSNGVTTLTDILNVNPGGNFDGARVIVEEGHQLQALRIELQNNTGHNAQFYQQGGTVVATSTTAEEGTVAIGRWGGNENSTYWLNGGTLYITNAGTYGKLALGVDGYGFFNQAGGTAMVRQLSLNERGGGGGGFFALSNGVFSLGSGGLTTEGGEYRVTFAGGTLAAWSNFSVMVTSTLSGANGPLTVDPAGYTITWNSALDGEGGLVLGGSGGTVVMAALHTYGGPTTLSNGLMIVNGSLSTGAVAVGVGSALGGTGTIAGPVASSGTVVPGYGGLGGRLALGNGYVQQTGGALALEIGLGSNDVLAITGPAALDGLLRVTNIAYTPLFGDSWTVLTATAISGTFASSNLPPLDPTNAWEVTYTADQVVLTVVAGGSSPTPYELWAEGIPNPALRGDQEDADGDGYANLWEYSQGTDPTNGLSGVKVTLARTNGLWALKFNRATGAVDLVYAVEAAYALSNGTGWTVISSNQFGLGWEGDADVTETNSGAVRQVFTEDNDPLVPRRGFRLRVTRP